MFNIAIADLEKELAKVQESGIRIGKERIRSVSYADDIVLLAESDEIMREMLKGRKRWIKRKRLELNTGKTKIMIFRKTGGRRKKYEFKWNEEKVELVKTFDYLGYKLKQNNKEGEHIKKLKGKANGVIGKMWSLAEKKFKNNWELRMRLFDVIVKGIITYVAEQWGWKETKEIERIPMKYIRWMLKINKNTPWQTIIKQ